MGIEIIQTESGKDAKTLDLLNQLAQTYKIKVGFHNHTQADGFPDRVAADLKDRPFLGSARISAIGRRQGLSRWRE